VAYNLFLCCVKFLIWLFEFSMNISSSRNQAAKRSPQAPFWQMDSFRFLMAVAILIGLVFGVNSLLGTDAYGRFQTFVTIFLGIFIEAVPFLLAGSILSGLLEIFVSPETIGRIVPRNKWAAALIGAVMGFAFPVCECGVVPVTRRLYGKGLPLSVGVAFLLAAPTVNPVVFASTYAAFGWGPILFGRFVVTIIIAFLIGMVFTFARPEDILQESGADEPSDYHEHNYYADAQGLSIRDKIWESMSIGGNDFLDMGRYLIIGSMMAALMQTFVPQATLLALGSGAVVSVVTLMVLAFVLSICSTVDAFLALSFVNSFTTGSILSFLTFGPMVDIKSSLMFLGVFKRKIVVYLIVLPMMLNGLAALIINFYTSW